MKEKEQRKKGTPKSAVARRPMGNGRGTSILIGGEAVTAVSFKGDPQRQIDRCVQGPMRAMAGSIPVFDGAFGHSLRDSGYTIEELMNGGGGAGGGGTGKSAYEIALDNGFVGDEAAWLASLVGKPGSTPVKGVDYFTAADMAELTASVIAGLPRYTGEVIA